MTLQALSVRTQHGLAVASPYVSNAKTDEADAAIVHLIGCARIRSFHGFHMRFKNCS